MKKLLTVLVAIALSVCSVSAFTACTAEKVFSGTELKIGYTIYPPMNYTDETGKFVGFDTELAEAVCEILGYTPKFIEIEWDNKVMSLNSGEIDAVWNGMTITDGLKEAMNITKPYLNNVQVVVCQASVADNYNTVADLAKAETILVESGSAGEDVVKDLGYTPLAFTAQRDTLLEVKTSANKIAVIDSNMAKVLTGEGTSYSDLTYKEVGFEEEEFGIGFRKSDSKLMKDVEDAIQQLKDNGTFATLIAKYFN